MISGGVITAFVFGLIYGSFLNVVIYRWDDWASIIRSRSACRSCNKQLRWYDLIPLLSFVSLSGRCRYCQKPIAWQYPVVELAAALLIAFGFSFIFSINTDLLTQIIIFSAYIIVVGSAIAIFFHDLYEMMVPDLLAYILLGSSILVGAGLHGWYGMLIGLLIGVVPIALLVYPSRGAWMGEGDVKLAASFGALVGYPAAIPYLFLAFSIGAVYGVTVLLMSKAKMKTAVPFAPFLIIAAFITFFYGQDIISWYLGVFNYAF